MSPRKTLLLTAPLVVMVLVSGWLFERIAHFNGEAAKATSWAVTGEVAPNFTLDDVEGKSVQLADFRNKKAVVVAFWASWCIPCRLELPSLISFYQHSRGSGVEVLAVSIDQDPAAARQFASTNKLPFPVLLDSQERVASRYQVNEIPTVLVIDRSGKLESRHRGLSPSLEAALTAEVRQGDSAPPNQNGN